MERLYNMGTTAEKLYRILDSKRAIKEALEAKGVVITDETTFSEYADLINEIVQGAISDADALTFIMDVADGKRKIARAVRNKYDETSGTASEITEYSTFDELSDKIAEIPIEVKSGNASFQNEFQKDENTLIKLPFFDVYNETLKAMASVGTGYNGVCAFELDKWSYDNDHKVILSGADAYYTSDGTFIDGDFNIKENGTIVGQLELTGENSALYQFQDRVLENTNRFVVFFSSAERYTVSKSLPATSCLNLWCVKGTPLMNFGNSLTNLNSVNVYDGELVLTNENDYKISNTSLLQTLNLNHIKEINTGYSGIWTQGPVKKLNLHNLQRVVNAPTVFSAFGGYGIYLPKLEYVQMRANGYFFMQSNYLQEINLPSLREINLLSTTQGSLVYYSTNLKVLRLPSLEKSNGIISNTFGNSTTVIELGKPIGGSIIISTASCNTLTCVTIEKGFKSTLNLGRLPSLTIESVHNIIDNLAICEGEDYQKYTITLSSSVMTQDIKDKLQTKGYKQGTLG